MACECHMKRYNTNCVSTKYNCIKYYAANTSMDFYTLKLAIYMYLYLLCDLILENRPVVTFSISRNTGFKYSSHCSSLVL